MEQQSLEIQAREIQNLPLVEKQEKALEAISGFASLARRTVQQGWMAGKYLTAVKTELPPGEFRRWLEENGISKSTAYRFIQVARIRVSQVGTLNTITAALKSLELDEKDKELRDQYEQFIVTAREQLAAQWRLGEALSKLEELGSEPNQARFLKRHPELTKETALESLHIYNTIKDVRKLSTDEVLDLVI